MKIERAGSFVLGGIIGLTAPGVVGATEVVSNGSVNAESITRVESEKAITMPEAIKTEDGRTIVPARALVEALGLKVDWVHDKAKGIQTVTYSNEKIKVVTTKKDGSLVFNRTAVVNGKVVEMLVPAKMIGQTTFLSIRSFGDFFGCGTDWDNSTKTVTVLEPANNGKVLVGKVGSKEFRVIENTYEAGVRRAAFFADAASKKDLLDSLKTSIGPVEPPSFIIDKKTGAQINYLSCKYNDRFPNDLYQQADFTVRFAGKVALNEKNTCFNYADKLVIFTGVDKKNIGIFTLSTGILEKISSTSDVSNIVVDPKDENNLIVKNAEGNTWNNGKWEAPPLVRTEAEKKLIKTALKFVAGGEYMQVEDLNNPVEKLSNGILAIYSSSANKAKEKEILLKTNKYGITTGCVAYCHSDGNKYLLNVETGFDYPEPSLGQETRPCYARRILSTGKTEAIIFDSGSNYNYLSGLSRLSYDKELGLVLFDGYRATHKWNTGSGKFEELDNWKNYGTVEERLVKYLKHSLVSNESMLYGNDRTKPNVNLFKLDAAEVAKYEKTHSSEGFKSFEVYKGIILVRSSVGLTDATAIAARKNIDKIDNMGLLEYLRDQLEWKVISHNISTTDFFSTCDFGATFDTRINAILVNKKYFNDFWATSDLSWPLFVLLGEARAQGIQRFEYCYDDGTKNVFTKQMLAVNGSYQADKYVWIKKIAGEKYQEGKISEDVYRALLDKAEIGIKSYGGE